MVSARELVEEARGSGNGESCRVLLRAPGVRIAAGARGGPRPAFFVEAVLDPFPRRPGVDPPALEGTAERVRRLAARGYAVRCDDDGRVACEKAVRARDLTREVAAVRVLLRGGP